MTFREEENTYKSNAAVLLVQLHNVKYVEHIKPYQKHQKHL